MMKPLKKLHGWSCITCAAAMVMGTDEETVIADIGHNGSKYAAFHDSEVIEVAMRMGYAVTCFQLLPQLLIDGQVKPVPNAPLRRHNFEQALLNTKGLLQGDGPANRHAFAYEHGTICDPDSGDTFAFTSIEDLMTQKKFYAQQLLIFTKVP